ncbi:hypothetical protein HMPREF3204_00971 [Gardnerella pickettii]|nr:hypothetical protein HMPREF3204_00971 [Gardnerella pickettii]
MDILLCASEDTPIFYDTVNAPNTTLGVSQGRITNMRKSKS